MAKAVIIDDEKPARENLRLLLNEYCPRIEVIGEAWDVASGLDVIKRLAPDIIFLDIRMPSGNEGFQLLKEYGPVDFLVVFVTAFKDYAIDAFKVNAVDYLLKPIDIDELEATCERILQKLDAANESDVYAETISRLAKHIPSDDTPLAISHLHGIKLVPPNSILYLQAEGNCTRLFFKDNTDYLDTRTLKVYEDLLDSTRFMRVHRSYIVSLDSLTDYLKEDGHFAILRYGIRIPVSKVKQAQLVNWIRYRSRTS